jgi:hypothetical protein
MNENFLSKDVAPLCHCERKQLAQHYFRLLCPAISTQFAAMYLTDTHESGRWVRQFSRSSVYQPRSGELAQIDVASA